MGTLDGKVIIITGAARGQGEAEAELAAHAGAKVVVTDIIDGESVAKKVNGLFIQHDVTSSEQWGKVVQQTLAQYGRIDGLVNNAGIWKPGGVTQATEAEFRQIIDVNQVGVFLGMQAVSATMIAQKSGSIVNISSVAGMRGLRAIAYAASKWAVHGMTKTAARELGAHNVRVNSVHPRPQKNTRLHSKCLSESRPLFYCFARGYTNGNTVSSRHH
ncbi:MAG: SDR family oxidoreductase [Actinobacteria bacterium]|nr:SDR family oxidoreductase [Actinomycetota bacterium]